MIYRTSQQLIDEYYANPAVSQSELKGLLGGKAKYLARKQRLMEEPDLYYEEPADCLIIGSGVDCIITQGEDMFNQKFHITTITKKPSDTIISILRHLHDTIKESLPEDGTIPTLADLREQLLASAEFHGYQPNYGADAKMKALATTDNLMYWTDIIVSTGKQVITLEEHAKMKDAVARIKRHFPEFFEDTNELLLASTGRDVNVFFQVPVYGSYRGTEIKGLIDAIVIEDGVASVYDFKTTSESMINFPSQVRKFRYDIQMAFYDKLITVGQFASFTEHLSGLSENVENFILLVVSVGYNEIPISFVISENLLLMGKLGRPELTIPAIPSGDESLDDEDGIDRTSITYYTISKVKGYHQLMSAYLEIQQGDTEDNFSHLLEWNS